MKEYEDIKESLQSIAAKFGPAALIPATVTTLNADDTIAVELSDGVTIDDVRLKSVVKAGTKFIITPALNSNILIGRIENSNEFVMISADEIKQVDIEIGSMKIFIDTNGIVFNGGVLHGLVTRDGVKQQLNKIEQDITNLKNAFNAWIPVANDGGAALKLSTTTWRSTALNSTMNTDIENTKVKQ